MHLTEARPSRPIETEDAARGLEQQAIGMLVDCLSMGTVQAPVEAYRHSAIMARLDRVLQTYAHEIGNVPFSVETCLTAIAQ
jgi:hypothetical protein